MERKIILIILIGAFVSLMVVPITVALLTQRAVDEDSTRLTQAPPERTADDIIAAIKKADSSLQNNDKPTFTLLGFKHLKGNWYVAWIDTKNTKVLINDPAVSAIYMYPLIGPGVTFVESDATSKGVPLATFKEFTNATL